MNWQESPDAELRNLEQKINRQIEEQIAQVNTTIANLPVGGGTTDITPVFQASPNYIPNSHPEWSTLAFNTAGTTPATAGDTNHECYNWYYILNSATQLLTTQPLLASAHSGFGGLNSDAPIWDRTNGHFHLGSVTTKYDICCPLPTDFVFPGQRFYVYFEASVTQSDTDIDDTEMFMGFYDNTAGQRKFIEGSDFTPTISVYGATGSRTLAYKIHARTDAGTEILSTEVSVANAPATLSDANHVRLSFTGAPGFIQYTIYRKDGSNFYRVGEIRNSIDLQFFDIQESGTTVVPVSGYPSVSANRPQAYAVTTNFTPAALGSFNPHTMTIQVPLTYNRSNTGNLQQWLRFGFTNLVASGSAREVVIRRIAVSEGYGAWARSQLDLRAASGPSTAATSGGSTGNPGGNPPPGGGGGPFCLVMNTNIDVPTGTKLLGELEKGSEVLYDKTPYRIKKMQDGAVQFVYEIETEDGNINRCSEEHRWPTTGKNKAARKLRVGMELLDRDHRPVKIVRIDYVYPTEEERTRYGGIPVRRIWLPAPHRFIANGIQSLNAKPLTE